MDERRDPLYLDALITDLETGETRRHQCEADYRSCFESGNWPPYIWVEGNYSCDCNLDAFFARAGGEEEAEDDLCGDTRFAYELTADGHDLASALRLLADWGGRREGDADPLRHATCGTPLEARWYCPTCAIPVDDADAPGDRLL